jgi:hypothetical protein
MNNGMTMAANTPAHETKESIDAESSNKERRPPISKYLYQLIIQCVIK